MSKEERRVYKALKEKERRARKRVDNGQGVDNLSGGVESRHAESPSMSVSIDGAPPSTVASRALEGNDLGSGSSAPPAQKSKNHDPELWAEALMRAARSVSYALKLPEFIRKGEEVFQTPEWQYEKLERYA